MVFLDAIESAIAQSKASGKLCYVFWGGTGYYSSFRYEKGWLFRAYPGGRKELSTKGNQILLDLNDLQTDNWSKKSLELIDLIQILDKEIKWCIDNPDLAFHSEYRKGFQNGLIQAKYLISELAKIDG